MSDGKSPGEQVKAKLRKRAAQRARRLAGQRRENLIEQIDRFEPLDVGMWIKSVGGGARVFDTGPSLAEADYGDEGCLVVVGATQGRVVSYVWDKDAGIRRWTRVSVLDPVHHE